MRQIWVESITIARHMDEKKKTDRKTFETMIVSKKKWSWHKSRIMAGLKRYENDGKTTV